MPKIHTGTVIKSLSALVLEYDANIATLQLQADAVRTTIAALKGSRSTRAKAALPGKIVKAIARTKRRGKAKPKAVIQQQRESTLQLLNQFTPTRPTTLEEAAAATGRSTQHSGIGILLRHGYLKKKRGGYVRTARPFFVSKAKAHENGASAGA